MIFPREIGPFKWFLRVVSLSLIYFLAARWGLSMALVNEQSSPVWPPSGIAVISLSAWGLGMWPGVFLGAFLANWYTSSHLISSLGIAIGNTLEAIASVYVLSRWAKNLSTHNQVLVFLWGGVMLPAAISAANGPLWLIWFNGTPANLYWQIWLVWWIGDVLGIMILYPVWLCRMEYVQKYKYFLWLALAILGIGLSGMTFLGHTKTAYLALIPIFVATMHGGLAGLSLSALLTSVIAIYGTQAGLGPFRSLLELQAFIGLPFLCLLLMSVHVVHKDLVAR